MRRGLLLALVLGLVMSALLSPPARGLTWTQTSAVDFSAGRLSNLTVLPTGDLQLVSTPTWAKTGVVLSPTPASYDAAGALNQFVMKDGTTYRMWYRGFDGSRFRILYATSTDGVAWTKQGIAIDVVVPPYSFDSAASQSVMKEGSTYKMWFGGGFLSGPFGQSGRIYYATSTDAASWTIVGVALDMGAAGSWDQGLVAYPAVVKDASGTYWMYYSGWDGTPGRNTRIGLATSTTGITFTKSAANPVLNVGAPGSWEDLGLNMPFVETAPPRILWYSAGGTVNRAGYATSADGFSWSKAAANPVLREGAAGAWDSRGAYSTCFLNDGGTEWMFYTGADGTTSRIGRARLVTDYAATGSFESAILDTGAPASIWNTLSANATVPPNTSLILGTRTGDVPTPDASWSAWSAPVPPGISPITSPRARYLQVRADLSTTNASQTPVLHDFTTDYAMNSASAPTPLSPVGGVWVNASGLRVSWAYSDPESDQEAGFRVQVSDRSDFATIAEESGDILSTSMFWRSPPLADGAWYWRVRTRDAFGAWSPYSGGAAVRIDTVPPTTLLDFALPPGSINGMPQVDSTNRILLSASDLGSGVTTTMYSLNLGPPVTYTAPFLPTSHGLAVLSYWSVDAAGNPERSSLAALLLDNAPAVAPVDPPSGTWTNSSRLTLAWTYADPEGDPESMYVVELATDPSFATVSYSSGQVDGTQTTHTFQSVADGTYYWRMRASDTYGAWSPFSTAQTVSVDTGLPSVTCVFSDTLGTVDGRVWITAGTALTLTATDAGSGVAGIYYAIDGATDTYSAPVTLSLHGPHTLAYWTTDRAGNAGPRSQLDFLIDLAPEATNRYPQDQSWVRNATGLWWTYADPDGDLAQGFEVQTSLDPSFSSIYDSSGMVSDSSGPGFWQLWPYDDGTYYWRVRVRDECGVWSQWSSPTRFQVDTVGPQVNALHGGSAIPALTGVLALSVGDTIALSATDAGSGVARIEYSTDAGGWTVYSSPIRFDTAGRHVLAFRATDSAGNTGATLFLAVDAGDAFNWTPIVAAILAVVLALIGAAVASLRKNVKPRLSAKLTWIIFAGPGTILELVIAVSSLVTGELAMPPWFGAGLITVLAVAVVGFTSIALSAKALMVEPSAVAESQVDEPRS